MQVVPSDGSQTLSQIGKKEKDIIMVKKISKLIVCLSVFIMLAACSIFSQSSPEKTSNQETTNSKSIPSKNSQDPDTQDEKLNQNSVILKDDPENKKFPKEIVTLLQTLLANDEELQRSALTPELASAYPKQGLLLPEDTVIYIDSKYWREENSYANIVGKIHKPGKSQEYVMIGFVHRKNGWKITVMEVIDDPKHLKENGFMVP